MNEANLATARKVILCAGLVVAALLFLFPHWRISISFVDGRPPVNYELGRAFIALKPLASAASRPLQATAGKARGVLLMGTAGSVIHKLCERGLSAYSRQGNFASCGALRVARSSV